jgi:hypothetical protein
VTSSKNTAQRAAGRVPRRAELRLLPPAVVQLSRREEEALVEALALALLPLVAGGAGVARGLPLADGVELEGGERGAGGDV